MSADGTEIKYRSELLETGLFCDVTVRCGSKTWKLHKAIICSCSTFFKKALTGDWEEARNGHVTIHEQDPEHVNWTIALMYTQDLPDDFYTSLVSDETKKMPAYGHLFAIVDYLGVERGTSLVKMRLRADLNLRATKIQAIYKLKDEGFDKTEYGSPEWIQALFDTIAMAYNSPSPTFEPLRVIFVEFFRRTRYVVVRHEMYREALFSIPELARDVLFRLVPSKALGPHSSQVLFTEPDRCSLCRQRSSDYSDVWISRGGGVNGVCEACCNSPNMQAKYQNLGLKALT